MEIVLPHNGWRPRPYQKNLWKYLRDGGKRALAICHRRWGKDEVCLHYTCIALHKHVGTYWHMLPEASQARKAVWEAINPHTGMRRIDEAFPQSLRATTRENEMLIKFKNGSTWQVLGSDNFNSLVGSPPVGVVFSEFALANPKSWAYIRPILMENNGWALFVSTPRGKNHLFDLLKSAKKSKDWYTEISTVYDSARFTAEQLEEEKEQYRAENGEGVGESLFNQEYLCSFEASTPGAYYAAEMQAALDDGRICEVEPIPGWPTCTAWDLGRTDSTAIWWFQVVANEVHVIDYFESNGKSIDFYCNLVDSKPYKYDKHFLPHDAKTKTLASNYSVAEQAAKAFGLRSIHVLPQSHVQDGIQAVRAVLARSWFDEVKCEAGLEALRQYRREYDEDKRCFRDHPLHDWASHPADGFRYMALAINLDKKPEKKKEEQPIDTRFPTLNDLFAEQERNNRRNRI